MASLPLRGFRLVWLLACWLAAARAQTQGSRTLTKRYLSLSKHPNAVCNDNSTGSFYYSGTNASDKWIVYFEGGEFCTNPSSCSQRRREWTTSSVDLYPDTMIGTDLFDGAGSAKSPFSDYHHVYVPYCSSDFHIASRLAPLVLDNGNNFYLRGDFIVRAVFQELEDLGLSNSSSLVMAGTSSGGLGALNHGIRLRQDGWYPNMAFLVDSAWFLDYENVLTDQYSMVTYKEALPNNTCSLRAREGTDLPCCVSAPCLVTNFVAPLDIPTFITTSSADTFVIGLLLSNTTRYPQFDFSNTKNDFATEIHSYLGSMNTTLKLTQASPVSLFQVGCGQHGFFRNVPLWGTVLGGDGQDTITIDTTLVSTSYRYRNTPGYWDNIATDSLSLDVALSQWLSSNFSRSVTWEVCRGFLCNPTCPDSLPIKLNVPSIPRFFEVLFLVLGLLMLFSPLLLKTILSTYGWYLRRLAIQASEESSLTPFGRAFTKSFRAGVSRRSKKTHTGKKLKYEASRMSLLGVLSGKELQLACRDISVTVSQKVKRKAGANIDSDGDVEAGMYPASPPASRRNDVINVIQQKKKKILDDVTVQFHTHQLVGIMGPSGSGKTTLLNVLSNQTQGYEVEGKILVNGEELWGSDPMFRRECGMLQQLSTPYFNELTVEENLFYCAMMRMDKDTTVEEKIERVHTVLRDVSRV